MELRIFKERVADEMAAIQDFSDVRLMANGGHIHCEFLYKETTLGFFTAESFIDESMSSPMSCHLTVGRHPNDDEEKYYCRDNKSLYVFHKEDDTANVKAFVQKVLYTYEKDDVDGCLQDYIASLPGCSWYDGLFGDQRFFMIDGLETELRLSDFKKVSDEISVLITSESDDCLSLDEENSRVTVSDEKSVAKWAKQIVDQTRKKLYIEQDILCGTKFNAEKIIFFRRLKHMLSITSRSIFEVSIQKINDTDNKVYDFVFYLHTQYGHYKLILSNLMNGVSTEMTSFDYKIYELVRSGEEIFVVSGNFHDKVRYLDDFVNYHVCRRLHIYRDMKSIPNEL